MPGSPCIDAGLNTEAHRLSDTNGGSRIHGGVVDIGCDEFGVATSDPVNVSVTAGYVRVVAGTAVEFEGFSSGSVEETVWNFGEGSILTNSINPAFIYPVPGTYTGEFSAKGPANSDVSALQVIIEHPITNFVSLSGLHLSP